MLARPAEVRPVGVEVVSPGLVAAVEVVEDRATGELEDLGLGQPDGVIGVERGEEVAPGSTRRALAVAQVELDRRARLNLARAA